MLWLERRAALRRAGNLLADVPLALSPAACSPVQHQLEASGAPSALRRLLLHAGIHLQPSAFLLSCVLLSVVLSALIHLVVSIWLIPITASIGFTIPFLMADSRAQRRATEFAEEFPTILLATASSLSAGHTALGAIERSVRLLPRNNPVRKEVQMLLNALREDSGKERALGRFGESIRLPELALFRSAFLLSLESGGRFAPTLQRLAQVLKDRVILIRSAQTVTSVMRMTANILLVIAPLILGIISARTPNFFQLLRENPLANICASIGAALVGLNFLLLRIMSDFRP